MSDKLLTLQLITLSKSDFEKGGLSVNLGGVERFCRQLIYGPVLR